MSVGSSSRNEPGGESGGVAGGITGGTTGRGSGTGGGAIAGGELDGADAVDTLIEAVLASRVRRSVRSVGVRDLIKQSISFTASIFGSATPRLQCDRQSNSVPQPHWSAARRAPCRRPTVVACSSIAVL